MITAVETIDRCSCFLLSRHFDEAETLAATSIAILDHLRANNISELSDASQQSK